MAIKDNLVSVWELDEASGDAVDSFGSNTLAENGGTVAATTGKVGGCREFVSASSQYFGAASSASLLTGDIDFTFAAWVYIETKGADRTIAAKWNTSSNREYWLQFRNAADRFRFNVSNNGTSTVSVDEAVFGAPSLTTWYWVCGGHNATSNDIWVSVNNGTPTTASHTTGVFTGTGDFRIAGISGASLYWNGRLDQVAFWKRDLRSTPSEMAAVYNGGSGLAYSSWDAGGAAVRRHLMLLGVGR